ncbi:hypothetical protein [Scytonema sp. HK-05]|uniref:hypothetical protein n=1 Tax=Scytonema sp. HK-05 TaxID=1137095 RepID=UPI001161477B|nr:hypothetical protein [Scytonema sp. HK-05]
MKEKQLINFEEVVNPEFLESAYSLPIAWTDPQDERSAWESSEEMERYAHAELPSVMRLIPEWERSPSEEFSICNQLPVNTTPEKFLEETEEKQPQRSPEPAAPLSGTSVRSLASPTKQRGYLYKYLENKKLKDGTIASYPRVIGERSPDNPKHWRWGFNWEEKIDGEWKGRSIGSVPTRLREQPHS